MRQVVIELVDTFPQVDVQAAEYKRLLGYPRGAVLSGRARELAEWARTWFAQHGRPWVYARQVESVGLTNGSILLDGVTFSSPRLEKTLAESGADGSILVAVSAGAEVEAEAQRLWLEEKPDEYFFLETFGSAVVEHLTTMTGARLCAWAESRALAVLPHYSPGYPEWEIAQQPRLLELIRRTRSGGALPGQIEVLDSGMLRPKKSLLAVFGLTRQTDNVRRLTDLVPCENCSFATCQYRRAPYRRAIQTTTELPVLQSADGEPGENGHALDSLDRDARYFVNAKALRRWASERLTLTDRADGAIEALFRYEGSTCSNMGRTMQFHYRVRVGPRADGYPILESHCGPAPGDEGHRFMCRYMTNAEHLMVAIDHEKPLLGQKLNDVLTWQRPAMAPSCYCEPASRKHKWGLVLETIHFALVQRDKETTEAILEGARGR